MSKARARVFIVEDHPMTARGLKMFLEASGLDVEMAHDLASGLKTAAKSEFDVLLCDLHLPDGSGWDLMTRLRKQKPVRGIAYSAFDEPDYVARSKAAGFLEHVVKGSTPEELVAAIDRAMRVELSPEAAGAGGDGSSKQGLDGEASASTRKPRRKRG